MESNQLVPERMKNKIYKITSTLMESGIYRFFERLNTFLEKIRAQKLENAEEDDFRALTMGDLRGPLICCSYLLGFAGFVFLLELCKS